MFLRMLLESLSHQRTRKLLAVAVVWIGLSLVIGLLAMGMNVQEQMNEQMRSFGANLKLLPAKQAVDLQVGGYDILDSSVDTYLKEKDLYALKTDIFWRNNILALNPRLWTKASIKNQSRNVEVLGVWLGKQIELEGGETFITGAKKTYPFWKVRGQWPKKSNQCLIGSNLAKKLNIKVGSNIKLSGDKSGSSFLVTGVLTGKSRENSAVVVPLTSAQYLSGLNGKVENVDISALTTPENNLARKYRTKPASLTPSEYENWACTSFPGSIAADIQETIPGSFVQVSRRVIDTQGAILSRIKGLMYVLGLATLLTSAISILGILSSTVTRRKSEAALLQAIGAKRSDVLILFLTEAGLLGFLGSALAIVTGLLLGDWLLNTIFNIGISPNASLFIAALFAGPLLAVAGSWWPTSKAVNTPPANMLHVN